MRRDSLILHRLIGATARGATPHEADVPPAHFAHLGGVCV